MLDGGAFDARGNCARKNVYDMFHFSTERRTSMNDSALRATGQCHCGAIRYSMSTAVHHHALCHCSDCRRHSGAPMVGWALVGQDEIEITGTPKVYASSEHGRRHFCGECGTGLFYTSEVIFPGQIDVQSATLDDPSLIPAQVQIQTAERIGWMEKLDTLPTFERYPPFE
jgi:hypothetical protein